jgi:alkylation response protein AidB-like acyl-CoA dehydrogenase
MDFDLTPEQQAIEELAGRLLADRSTPDALRVLEASDDDRFDRPLWQEMADAGLLALVVPEEHGGAGLGIVELCLLLREVGRRTAAVPALATLALGVLPLARWGSDTQRAAVLPSVASGELVLSAALAEPLGDPREPTLVARPDADGWVLDGVRSNVPYGMVADLVLVPALVDGEPRLFLVEVRAPGVTRHRQATTSGVPEALLELDGLRVHQQVLLGGRSGHPGALSDCVDLASVAACAVMAGAAAEAVRITGEYTTARQQFGRSIASFQAVTQRAADAYVDAQGIELTMLQAAWRLGAGRPADREVATAKYWAAAGGQRVVHAAQHLHGGMGVDRDYPLHRYFLLAKQLELFLGGATRQLLRLGAILAEEGPVRA